ncbi:MAG TPA: glycine--tRNA ligase subunit beta [Alphaproteobacteria bacterium]|nr:glycine--tRNA ligase subunit beta [Alphaproteobacteria bacterium]
MAEWLFEIFSEEIPSRMQPEAQEQLKTLTEAQLNQKELSFESIKTFITPRRLTVVVAGLPSHTLPIREEKKGPRVDASQTAIDGFLKTAGVRREDCEVRETPKGSFLFVIKNEPGRPTQEVLSQIAPTLLEKFRWPKSMRWGGLAVTWVRPIRGLLSILDGTVVPFSYAGLNASNKTRGHRFLAPEPFTVDNFQDYEKKLKDHYVILDWAERRRLIEKEMTRVSHDAHLTPLEDPALLDEVTGLVEWPVAYIGAVDKHFMNLPPKVITTPMRVHQRYFPLNDSEKKLAPSFGIIANIEGRDHGKTIVIGNERVLRARLADAQFFWEQDQKKPLDHFNTSLKTRLFHQHLGSLFDKVERLVKLSSRIAQHVGENQKIVERAALLSKADLASQMVGEFPELQGIMGCYYAQNQSEAPEVARAIEEHYWPKVSGGEIPDAIPSLILAIADRLDSLVGFFTIGITPTGSKDPFALRRAGLSLIALSLNPHFSLSMVEVLGWAYDAYPWSELTPPLIKNKEEAVADVWQFLLERFKFALRDGQGSPYDHVDAVLGVAHKNPTFSDLALRVQALDKLMDGEDGQNLLAAYKRASNILKIEEEKDKQRYEGQVREETLKALEEKILFTNLSEKSPIIQELVAKGDFVKAVQDLATLRPFVDQFFEKVVVNSEEANLRMNRLHLLAYLRKTLQQVADFSKIEG